MTILFLDDWYDKHPGAIIDTETPNKSFLRYSALLRDMGIKNHAFCLALHNKELQGIDPFDPNLSIEQIMMIALEAKENFWFYVRSLCKVPGTGLQRTPFRANRGNIALYWLFFNHVTMSLIQPRQTGKSFSTDMLHSYCLNIASTDTYIAMLTKDETLRGRALSRLKDIIDELPYYLNQKTKKDVANTEEISIKRLDNRYRGLLPSKSPKAAMNVGRGLTAPIFHIDEIAFIYNIAITLPAALPATTAARAIADSKGEPYGNIFTTTAGKKDDPDGRYAYEIVTNSAVWSEKFLDAANINELEKLIRANSPGGEFRVNCTFSHRQLGYSDAWLKEQLEITGSKGEDADRDYFNIWTAGNQSSPFPVEIAERIRKSENPDPYIEISKTYGYITRWYIPLESIEQRMRASHYILGVDTSDAVGRDDIGLVLRDIKTGAVIADATINETNIIVFTKWLAQWLITYDNITLIIERRSSGASIIDLLLILLVEANINPFQRIYNKVVQERDEKPERFAEVSKRFNYNATELINKYKATFGFATSGGGVTSRTELYSTTLTNATKNTCDMVYSKQIIDQMLGLIIKNGRVDHQDGEHDDLCFVGSTLVRTINGNIPISSLKLGDLVLTRQGYKPVINIFCNEREIISKFGITGTPGHPFITPLGEVPFKDLTLKSKVYVWNEKQSCTMEKDIIDTLSLKDLSIEIIFIVMTKIMNRQWLCIDRFGKIITDPFLRACRYITWIMIFPITVLRTSSCYLQETIDANIPRQKKHERNSVISQKNSSRSKNGVSKTLSWLERSLGKTAAKAKVLLIGGKKTLSWLKRSLEKQVKREPKQELIKGLVLKVLRTGGNKTLSWLKRWLENQERKEHSIFLNGGKKTLSWLENLLITGGRIILSWLNSMPEKQVKREPRQELRKELVYNLTIADCHEYFVNDILVHNCIGWLLSFWLMTQGKNLSFYGINTRDILVSNPISNNQRTSQDQTETLRQKFIQDEINALVESIQNEKNEFLVFKYESKLKRLAEELNNEEAIHSIDKLLETIKESKRINRKMQNNFKGYGTGYSRFR